SSTVQVTFFAETAEEATQTLDIIMEQYMLQHEWIYTGSTRMLKFYEDERERVGSDLQAAEDRLKQWQETGNIVSIDEQISRQLMTQGDRERALQQVEAELGMSRDNVRDPVVAKLKGDLVTSEVGLQDLLQRYTDKDRHVQERREQISLIKRQLAAAEKAFLTSLTSQRDILRKQIQDASASLADLRERKFQGNRMTQAVELARESHQLYGRKLEEARIAARLDREQLSNVAVIEQPHPTLMTDLNKRIGGVFLAAIAGIALGVAIAFAFEFFNNSLRTEDDVENYLGLPVLAAIPELRDRTLALKS
ncbi:MAG: GumC family protein, partial [Candidatus Entotheonellia bacterium]